MAEVAQQKQKEENSHRSSNLSSENKNFTDRAKFIPQEINLTELIQSRLYDAVTTIQLDGCAYAVGSILASLS